MQTGTTSPEIHLLPHSTSDVKDGMIPLKEGDIIDLGDRPLEIIDNPGHTPGSIAILDVKNRVLIGGAQEIIAGTADSTLRNGSA